MTAVEFAVEQLEQLIPSGHQLAIRAILEQAKEMEKQQQGYSEEEVWTQTMYLRFFLKRKNGCKSEKILQQLYTSNLGNREWTDIPTLSY
jgi:hypothetical protein